MRVSDSSRVLFVHVQKTGGSTIDHMFDEEVPDARRVAGRSRHTSYPALLRAEPGLAGYWSCGFVRNPWARMVSWFTMVNNVYAKRDAGDPKALRKFERFPGAWGVHAPYARDFRAFVLEGTAAIPKVGRPQVDALTTGDGRRVDFVGRTENFLHDVNVVRERLGLPPAADLPRRNATSRGHYSEWYDDETRARVAEVYARDIEEFGYAFEEQS